jgi:uncharacterized protein YegP (UPF0339 family)
MKTKFEIYRDKKNEWRWRYIASNGRIMADSGEGYKNLRTLELSINKMVYRMQTARKVIKPWKIVLDKR